jgi:hypothetical protein
MDRNSCFDKVEDIPAPNTMGPEAVSAMALSKDACLRPWWFHQITDRKCWLLCHMIKFDGAVQPGDSVPGPVTILHSKRNRYREIEQNEPLSSCDAA